jgi:hypothetical protein
VAVLRGGPPQSCVAPAPEKEEAPGMAEADECMELPGQFPPERQEQMDLAWARLMTQEQLSTEQRELIFASQTEFKDVIFLLQLGRTNILTHHIQLRPDAKPSRNTMWRVKKAYEKHALGGRADDAGGRPGGARGRHCAVGGAAARDQKA